MKVRVFTAILLLVLLLGPVGSAGLAQDSAPQSVEEAEAADALVPAAKWFLQIVDADNDRGMYSSTALFPGSGRPWIAYYDNTDGDLYLARFTGAGTAGNNCGPNNAYKCEAVPDPDSAANNIGRHASIAIHRPEALLLGWKVGIAYQDATAYSLKLAEYSCTFFPLPGSCSWSFTTIQAGTLMISPGAFSSLQYDSGGNAHIAYYLSSPFGTDALRYAHEVESGGSCGAGSAAGKWQCDTIENGEGMGRGLSLALNTMGDPYIAYYDGTAQDLRYAWMLPGGNCGPGGNSWRCIVIDDTGDVGKYPVLTIPSNLPGDVARIAYYDATNMKLKLASINSENSNCGGPFPWRCITIDDMGEDPGVRPISMATHNGQPMIAYRARVSDGLQVSQLRIAYPRLFGNCGPGDILKGWRCDTVDSGLRITSGSPFPIISYHDVGRYPSIGINSSGLPVISYYNDTADDLLIAYQLRQLFTPLLMRAP